MSHHILEAKDLSYTYPDRTPALKHISFRILHGESVALAGANGAGKTTLLLHLAGCLMPQTGSLRVGDMPVTPKTVAHIRRTVGMLFQDPDDQLFMPTVFDDVAFGPLNQGLPPEEVEQRVSAALAVVGADALRLRPPQKLSRGEKRSVAIAAVLSMTPNILVMDEPSSNLDPATRRRVMELLASFRHTKIIATHDLDLVLDLCERTILLQDGQILADGPTKDLFTDEALLKKCRLEKPLRMQGCPVCGRSSESV